MGENGKVAGNASRALTQMRCCWPPCHMYQMDGPNVWAQAISITTGYLTMAQFTAQTPLPEYYTGRGQAWL